MKETMKRTTCDFFPTRPLFFPFYPNNMHVHWTIRWTEQLAPLPRRERKWVQLQVRLRAFLYEHASGVCMFSLSVCVFSLGTPVFFYSPKP